MVIFGLLIVTVVGLYMAFMAVNDLALRNRQGTAMVIRKEYRDASRIYSTQVIGGRTQTIPQTTPEMYLLHLDVEGRHGVSAVAKSLYDHLEPGNQVQVIYQQRRLTGALQVVDVFR
jgi:hypothetical protein